MQNFKSIETTTATGKTKQIFDGLQVNLGMVPNLARVLANSPAALDGYISFRGALGHGKLPAATREAIAIAVANENSCDYCLSAHTVLGKHAGITGDDLISAQNAQVKDAKTTAALRFAVQVVKQRGHLPAAEVDTLRDAGFDDAEIVEIIAHVALNIYTNYFNHIAGTEIDFPVVPSQVIR